MKAPCRWMNDYVEFEIDREAVHALAERLTLAGIEVEGIEETGTLTSAFVGRVTSCKPHEDSDHLSVCTVDVGTQAVRLVCGASNVCENALVPVILAGGVLPGGFKIERRTIRSVESGGMICSKEELGLEPKSDGIWIFDPGLSLEVGTDLSTLLEYDDYIFDFKVASNRPDCASVYGIAREIAAVLDRPLRPLESVSDKAANEEPAALSVEIEDPNDTPRYALRLFENVRVGPSPLRIQHRLIKAGMRPLSNAVDATNYAMLEVGQPLHPFDADRLTGHRIAIRRASDGEVLRTLDGVDRRLTRDVLVIADEGEAVALAGIMGGEPSEIHESTSRLLLEIATFRSRTIRGSGRTVGLRSEASQRFERELDPRGVPFAADRAAYWLRQLTGCHAIAAADEYPNPMDECTLHLDPLLARRILGIDMDAEGAAAILRRLQIDAHVSDASVVANVPWWRPDLERDIDLVEDIGRIYGYDRFPTETPRPVLRVGRKDRIERGKDNIRTTLVGLGLSEVLTDGFDIQTWREHIGLPADDLVTTRNPMTSAQNALRSSLIPGLLAVVETNLNHGVDGGRVFEIGRVFSRSEGERDALAGALFGRTGRALKGKETVSLEHARAIVDSLLSSLHLLAVEIDTGQTPPFLHPGRSARYAYEGEAIGVFGELSPAVAASLGVRVLLFEMRVDRLLGRFGETVSYKRLARFPVVKRDLSLSAPIILPEARIRTALLAETAVETVTLYDQYNGDQIGADRKSLTYEISLRHPEKTLTDEESADIVTRIEGRLRKLDVHLRSQ